MMHRGLNAGIQIPQQQATWMAKPSGDANPLAYLKPLDEINVKQVVSMTEMMFAVSGESKYGVFNNKGEQVFYAHEESDRCQRLNCPKTRQFILHIVDQSNQEIIRVEREFRCCAGACSILACCDGCRQEIKVQAPAGTPIGSVVQECSFGRPNYSLRDDKDNQVMFLVAPHCICDGPYSCCCDNKFTLFGQDGSTEIGAVFKKYRGYIAEAMTSADEFSMKLPVDMDVRMKAVALAALFLVDFAHFAVVNRQR